MAGFLTGYGMRLARKALFSPPGSHFSAQPVLMTSSGSSAAAAAAAARYASDASAVTMGGASLCSPALCVTIRWIGQSWACFAAGITMLKDEVPHSAWTIVAEVASLTLPPPPRMRLTLAWVGASS